MKNGLLATVSYLAVAATCSVALVEGVAAADLVLKAPARVAPIAPTWNGLYIGGSLGALSYQARNDISDPWAFEGYGPNTVQTSKLGFIGGMQLGYNWQFKRFVLGVEGDISYLNADASSTIAWVDSGETARVTNKANALATIRARFGFDVLDGTLVYGTAGIGWVNVESNLFVNALSGGVPKGGNFSRKSWTPGFVAGGGVEHMLTNNWTVRGEVLAVFMETTSTGPTDPSYFNTPQTVKDDGTLVIGRIGANYKF